MSWRCIATMNKSDMWTRMQTLTMRDAAKHAVLTLHALLAAKLQRLGLCAWRSTDSLYSCCFFTFLIFYWSNFEFQFRPSSKARISRWFLPVQAYYQSWMTCIIESHYPSHPANGAFFIMVTHDPPFLSWATPSQPYSGFICFIGCLWALI